MSTMESLQQKLQQLHGYIRRLGELTTSTSTLSSSTTNTTVITVPSKLIDIDTNELDQIDDKSTASYPVTNTPSLSDLDAIQQWLNTTRQHIITTSHQHNKKPCNQITLITQLAAAVRNNTIQCNDNKQHARSKIPTYSTLQPVNKNRSLLKSQLILPQSNTSNPLQSSVPIRDYSPANTAFINGVWVNTNTDELFNNSTIDNSINELESIDDFDCTPVQVTKQHTSQTTNNKHSKSQYYNTVNHSVNKPFSLSNTSTPSHQSNNDPVDIFDIALDHKIHNDNRHCKSVSDTGKGQFIVPADTKFVNGRWESEHAESNELDDIDDFESTDNYDGSTTQHTNTQPSNNNNNKYNSNISPTSRASVRSDLEGYSDDELDEHITAARLPSMTLIRADQYIAPNITSQYNQSIESTELDNVSDFDSDHDDDDIQQNSSSDTELRNDLDDFMDDDDNDTDSISINDASYKLQQSTGSSQIVDKSKLQLYEFQLDSRLIQQWNDDARRTIQYIQPFNNVSPHTHTIDPLQLLLSDQYNRVSIQPSNNKHTILHIDEEKQLDYVDNIDDL